MSPLCKRCGHPLSHHVVRRLVPRIGGGQHHYNRCDDCTFGLDYWQFNTRFHEFYPIQPKQSESRLEAIWTPRVKAYIYRLQHPRRRP